ncbi:MAG: MurR/RpiR family transcriptional regulator [Lachnospiraceae bacterium]|nr:MurR/RpiR family transcriptional regulator [Lachnospiraceae bacterium]
MSRPYEFEIKKMYADLRRSEQKAADYYLHYDGPLEELSLASMAEAAEISQPTVMRFVKALGFRGFKEFKYGILKDSGRDEEAGESEDRLVPPPLVYGYAISEKDLPEDVPGRVVAQAGAYLDDTLKHISASDVSRAAEMICSARQIAIYYVENSASIAHDLLTKLLYLGFNCIFYSDFYLQQVSAANLSEGDLAIGISYSGTSKNTVDVMKLARKKGASSIAITNFPDSLVGKYSDIVLETGNQQLLYGNAIFSRTSQIAVVDMIYTGIILRDYKKYTKKLDESSRIVREQAYGFR